MRAAQRSFWRGCARSSRRSTRAGISEPRATCGPKFYADRSLIEVRLTQGDKTRVRYLLDGSDALQPLDGRSDPIHAANACESLRALDAGTVLDYLRFFVFFLRGSEGPFTLLEAELELIPAEGESENDALSSSDHACGRCASAVRTGQGRFLVPATVAYDGTMWRTTLAVSPGGEVEMIDEKDPVALGAVRVPECPYIDPPVAAPEEPAAAAPAPTAQLSDEPAEAPPEDAEAAQAVKPPVLEETVSDRDITRAVVSVLLADAVRERVGNTLLKRFNSQTQADDPVAQLARFVSGFAPHHHHRSGHSLRRRHRRRLAGTGAWPQGQARRGPGQGGVGRRLTMLPGSLAHQCRRLLPDFLPRLPVAVGRGVGGASARDPQLRRS